MSNIALRALQADNPIAFLAALGTLRILDGLRPEWQPRLGWIQQGGWIPVLSLEGSQSLDEVGIVLANKATARATGAEEFGWADVIAVAPEAFHAAVEAALDAATLSNRETVDFFAAFAAEGAVSNSGKLKPTAFCMTSGQMKFLKEIRAIASTLTASPKKGGAPMSGRFCAALAEPWEYGDEQHSLGWDPSNEPLHALGAYDPSGKGKQTSVREVVYLAVEALCLFPVFSRSGRLRTTGFHSDERRRSWFHWPVWEPLLSLRTIRALLQLGELADPTKSRDALAARGISLVYRARRHTFGQDYGILRPAEVAAHLLGTDFNGTLL